jgi:hypothetical protein
MRRALLTLVLFTGVVTLPGCGDDSPDLGVTSENGGAVVLAEATPLLVSPSLSGVAGAPWQIAWTTTVRETAGVPVTVQRIAIVLVDTKLVLEGASLAAAANSGLSIGARGSATFRNGLVYGLPEGGSRAVVSIVVDCLDATGRPVTAEAQLRIL